MKRIGNIYYKIPIYENLCLAYWKSARGKQTRQEVINFRNDFKIYELQDELLHHDLDIGHYHFFKVCDPKTRSICAASFKERVLHHAIMNICEPILESYAIYDSYACRKGKGNCKAVLRAQEFSRKFSWYLKLDIQKYFDSIDHDIIIEQLSFRIKDRAMLLLFRKLLNTYHTQPGKGMPIGNLISQHLANFYLGCFDHWIKEKRRARAYLRYMDDFILFGHNRAYLKEELAQIRQFLLQKLTLTLKDNIQLNRCCRGIPFLGYRIFPHTIRLSQRSRRRFLKKFLKYEGKWQEGEWSVVNLSRHMEPLIEFTRTANTREFRWNIIKRFGAPS